MKKKLIVLLMAVTLSTAMLAGCGKAGETTAQTEETQAETTQETAQAEVPTAELAEDTKETPYFDGKITVMNGKEFSLPFAVSTCSEEEQTKLEYKGVTAEPVDNETITIDNVVVTDDEDDKYSDIQIDMTVKSTYRLTLDYFEYEEVEYLVNCQSNFFKLIDFYTGQTMPYLTYDSKAPGYDFTKVINWGGKNYNVSYSVVKNSIAEQGDWEADEEDTEFRYEYYDSTFTHSVSVYIKMPKEYDGLMFYAKNNNVEFDDEMYYENKCPDSVVFFDENKAENMEDYMFVKVTDLIK